MAGLMLKAQNLHVGEVMVEAESNPRPLVFPGEKEIFPAIRTALPSPAH